MADLTCNDAMIEQAAFGIFMLEAPLLADHAQLWADLPQIRRDLYRARARFIFGYITLPE